MKLRPLQSQCSQDHSAVLCNYLPMKCHIFQGRLPMWFFAYSSSLCGPFAYHPFAVPSDNHTMSFPFLGPPLLLDAGETQTGWMRTHPFSHLLFLLLLFFQIKVSYLSTGQKLCSVLPLDSHTELLKGFFQLHFFANLTEIFTSDYFKIYRVRVTITSLFIPICV